MSKLFNQVMIAATASPYKSPRVSWETVLFLFTLAWPILLVPSVRNGIGNAFNYAIAELTPKTPAPDVPISKLPAAEPGG